MLTRIFGKKFVAAGMIVVFIGIFSGCMKTTVTVPPVNGSSTIAAIIRNGSTLTVFDSVLSITGLLSTLDDQNNTFTVFTPPNIAFAAVGIYDSTMYKYSLADLARLSQYHILAGYAKTAALITADLAGPNAPYVSASGDTLYFTVNQTGIYVNGNPLTQTDVLGINGVMHAVSRVLIPPTGSVWHTLTYDSALYGDSSFTYLVAALNRASTSATAPILDSLLSSGGVYSIFAPSNNAFRADTNYNFSSLDAINTNDPDSLVKLLSHHIVPGRVFSSDFSQTTPLATLLPGDSIHFSLNFGTEIIQKDLINFANISVTNLMATNGVIHRIEQVLQP